MQLSLSVKWELIAMPGQTIAMSAFGPVYIMTGAEPPDPDDLGIAVGDREQNFQIALEQNLYGRSTTNSHPIKVAVMVVSSKV